MRRRARRGGEVGESRSGRDTDEQEAVMQEAKGEVMSYCIVVAGRRTDSLTS